MRTALCTASGVLTRLKLPAGITHSAGHSLCTLGSEQASSNLWPSTAQRVMETGGSDIDIGGRHRGEQPSFP